MVQGINYGENLTKVTFAMISSITRGSVHEKRKITACCINRGSGSMLSDLAIQKLSPVRSTIR